MNETDVALTQVVSQMSAPNLHTVAEDLMQTRRMTMEDLIESNEVMVNFNMSIYTHTQIYIYIYIYIYVCITHLCYVIVHFRLMELNLMSFSLLFFF